MKARRRDWAALPVVANLPVFALMWGWRVEDAATAAMYRHDRRA